MMFRAVPRICLAFILVGLCVSLPKMALGQIAPTNTAVISGSVRTSTGAPVASATVTISGPKNATTSTDSQGYFAIVGAPFGNYQITVRVPALGTATQQIRVERDVNVAIQYSPQSSALKTIANVSTRSRARFNVTAASISAVYPTQYMLNGQTSWKDLLQQIPGVAWFQNFGAQITDLPING